MAVPGIESDKTKGMIFPEVGHPILENILRVRTQEGARKEPINEQFCDFDKVQYNVLIDAADLDSMMISLAMPALGELMQYGAQVVLDDHFPGMMQPTPVEGYDITLKVNLAALPCPSEELVGKMSQLKRRLAGAPFDQCLAALAAGHAASLPPIKINFRPDETTFIVPRADRVVVIFQLDFPDATDQAIAQVFLAEIATCRQPEAPAATFSRDQPMELQGVPDLKESSNFVGYLSLSIEPTHVNTPEKRTKVVTLMQTLRAYLHYHIKASKSYLHMRMRHKVVTLLQVLNRAVPEKDPGKVQKKTMAGKTFTRR